MATQVESIPRVLGALRKDLIEQGFTGEQAFWLIQDLVRKGDYPTSLLDEE